MKTMTTINGTTTKVNGATPSKDRAIFNRVLAWKIMWPNGQPSWQFPSNEPAWAKNLARATNGMLVPVVSDEQLLENVGKFRRLSGGILEEIR